MYHNYYFGDVQLWQTGKSGIPERTWSLSVTSMHFTTEHKQCTPLNTINTGDSLPCKFLWRNLVSLDKRSKVEGMFSFSWCMFLNKTLWCKLSPSFLAEEKGDIDLFQIVFSLLKRSDLWVTEMNRVFDSEILIASKWLKMWRWKE